MKYGIACVTLALASNAALGFSPNSLHSLNEQIRSMASEPVSLKASAKSDEDNINNDSENNFDRRRFLSIGAASAVSIIALPQSSLAESAAVQDSVDVSNFLRTGVDTGGPMGVSSQAGKSRPQTGVVLRDGSDVSQDTRSGNVLAEILVGTKAKPVAVLTAFSTPWKLETGSVYDVECRDSKTGDGAFLAVTANTGGKSLDSLPSSFFLERLFDPTGRFSFYGPPTDIKVKKSTMTDGGDKRLLELSFSNLSQSTNAEIPRKVLIVASIPPGTENAVMLVASAKASRWSKGAETLARAATETFRAVPAPKSNLKLRAKDRSGFVEF